MQRKPKVGDVVLWYSDSERNQQPLAAVVTRAGRHNVSICLNVMDPNTMNFLIRDAVRHIDDPRSRTDEGRREGAWDWTDRDKQIDALLDELQTVKE